MSDPTPATAWGPQQLDGGETCFRLWAPSQAAVSLRTPRGDLAMERSADGWFQIASDRVAPGDGYGFVLADGMLVPDPAARAQMHGVHGLSRLTSAESYRWRHADWRGRPWEEAVVYELHVGTYTPAGTFAGVAERLDHLAALGVTAIEIMPVAQFSGLRGWGYDGVLLYAPHDAYGTPDDLKALIDSAHGRDLMVLLDVVYNHFGPDGNYLHLYAPTFFDAGRQTPWGAAIAYERPAVRDFIRDNVLYWLQEFRFDGLRFDAIDQIRDPSPVPILDEIARVVRDRLSGREVHLISEDSRNLVRLHRRDEDGRPRLFTAEWNDDFHNVAHAVVTRESEGYYRDFATDHWRKLARALAEGYVFQGEVSVHWGNRPRGEPCGELPPVAFVNFLQNHDQTGNRAFGERLLDLADPGVLEVLTVMLLLGPAVPLLFMGEEWGETRPFCFFTDFDGALAEAVREGRRREFEAWAAFAAPESRAQIPDPNAVATFEASRPDWGRRQTTEGQGWLALYRRLLEIRHGEIVPHLARARGGCGRIRAADDGRVQLSWRLGDGVILHLDANLAEDERAATAPANTRTLFALPRDADETFRSTDVLPARAVVVSVSKEAAAAGPAP